MMPSENECGYRFMNHVWGQNGSNTAAAGSGGNGGNAISGSGFTVIGNNTNTVKGAI